MRLVKRSRLEFLAYLRPGFEALDSVYEGGVATLLLRVNAYPLEALNLARDFFYSRENFRVSVYDGSAYLERVPHELNLLYLV